MKTYRTGNALNEYDRGGKEQEMIRLSQNDEANQENGSHNTMGMCGSFCCNSK
jgi:hypothetical protein